MASMSSSSVDATVGSDTDVAVSPPPVVAEYERFITEQPNAVTGVAVFHVLTGIATGSAAETMMMLQVELKAASDVLQQAYPASVSLLAAVDIFGRYAARTRNESETLADYRDKLAERGRQFSRMSETSRAAISTQLDRFIADGKRILIHGCSRVVLQTLVSVAKNSSKRFSVLCTEGRPHCQGYRACAVLTEAGIPTTLVLDAAVGAALENVDFVILGAEGVTENGGVVNSIGSYQIAIAAKFSERPVYVCAESLKFSRLFPLTQSDLPETKAQQEPLVAPLKELVADVHPDMGVHNPACDYTPPHLLTLLFTDLGTLTPSAVSDELIKICMMSNTCL